MTRAMKTMGRKKKSTGDAPPPYKRLSVQCTAEWLEWVEEGADHCRTDVSKLVDASIEEHLRAKGFTKKPPRRIL